MRRLRAVIWILSVLTLFIAYSQTSSAQSVSAVQDYKQARTLASNGRWREALNMLDHALKQEPRYDDALYLAGICHLTLNEPEKALPRFSKLTEVKPDFFAGWGMLAQTYVKLEQFDKARLALAEMAKAKGGAPESQYMLGVLDWIEGNTELAEKEWREAIRLKHDMAKAHHNLGVLLRSKGDRVRALQSLQEALRFDPENAFYRLDVAVLQHEMGDKINSTSNLDKVRAQTDRRDIASLAVAFQMLWNNKFEACEKAASRALEDNPDLTEAMLVKAKALEALNKTGEAKELYQKIVKAEKSNKEAKEALDKIESAEKAAAEKAAAEKAAAEKAEAEKAAAEAESEKAEPADTQNNGN